MNGYITNMETIGSAIVIKVRIQRDIAENLEVEKLHLGKISICQEGLKL